MSAGRAYGCRSFIYMFNAVDVFPSFIAIMLGRLQMEVDDCIAMYSKLLRAYSDKPGTKDDGNPPRLQIVMSEALEAYGRSGSEALCVATGHCCRV